MLAMLMGVRDPHGQFVELKMMYEKIYFFIFNRLWFNMV